MFRSGRLTLCLAAAGLMLLSLPACGRAVRSSLRANVNVGKKESSEQLVADAMNTGVMLMSKLMANAQDVEDGPQPSKASMALADSANDLFYTSYQKLKLARTSAEAALELIQMNDKSRWETANQDLEDAKRLMKDGSAQRREGQNKLNQAYSGSPDVDPNAKVWSQTAGMARRTRNLEQDVQASLSKLKRKAPKGFNLIQLKTSSGFKQVSEKKLELKEDSVEDSLVSYVENYKFM